MAIDKSDYKRIFATVFTHAEELLLSAKQHPNALNQYIESWQEVAEKAAEVENLALQDVVLLFIDATDSAFKQLADADNLPDAQWQLLKRWDSLFTSYINAPDHQECARALIQCLNDPLLAMDLSSEDEQVLLGSFLPVIQQLQASSSPQDLSTDKDESAQQLTVWEKLAVLFKETDSLFQELLKQSNEEEYSENVKQYLESWKVVAEFINFEPDDSLAKILDIVSVLIEFSCQLFDQVERLNTAQQDLLKQWHNLFGSYIKIKGSQQLATALVRLLTSSVWLQPISSEDESMLLSELQVQDISSSQKETIQPPTSLTLDAAQSSGESVVISEAATLTITEDVAPLSSNIKNYQDITEPDVIAPTNIPAMETVSPASLPQPAAPPDIAAPTVAVKEDETATAQPPAKKTNLWQQLELSFNETVPHLKSATEQQLHDDETALKTSLQHYLESWLALAQQIEVNGEQPALLDVVLLFIEVSRQTFEQLKDFERKHITLLNKWQSLFSSYLKAKGNRQLAVSLIKCLRDPLWQGAIEAEDEEMLLAGFAATSVLKTEPVSKAVGESADKTQPADEEITVVTEQTLVADQVAETSDIFEETPEISLLEEAQELSEEVFFDETAFGDQDQKNLVWQNLQPTFNQALALLQAAIDSEISNDEAAFKLGLQNYVAAWQAIADLIENDENLTSLFDVVSLFIEITKQTVAELDSLSSEQFALLNNWQTNFSGFFTTHQQQDRFAIGLVKCLENPVWSEPITTEDGLMLLEGFGITEPETDLSVDIEQNPLWQKIAVFFDDAQSQLPIMQELLKANNPQSCLDYFKQYAERWLVIAEIITEEYENLQALADSALLFADNCAELVEQNSALTENLIQILQAWQSAFIACLQDVTDINAAEQLCTCLENKVWLRPLTAVDKEMLLAMQAEQRQYQPLPADEAENLLMFNEGMFAEDEIQDYAMFAEEDYEEPVVLTETEEFTITPEPEEIPLFADEDFEESVTSTDTTESVVESEEAAMFLDESFEESADEDFNLFAEDLEVEESAPVLANEEPEQVALFADEESETDLDEDFSLFAEESPEEPVASTSEELTFAVEFEEEPALAVITAEELPESSESEAALLPVDVTEIVTETAVLDTENLTPAAEQELHGFAGTPVPEETKTEESSHPVPVNPELIGMVRDEFDLLVKEFNLEINAAADAQAFKAILKNHEFKLDNLSKACHTIGLLGLEQVFGQLSVNMRSRRDSDVFSDRESELFKAVLPLIQDYIAGITQRDKAVALVTHLSAEGWKQPLTENQAQPLLKLLSGLVLSSHNQELDNRKTQAEPSDVSLEMPEDVNSELLDSLLNELPVLTNNFSAVIQQIISKDRELPQLLEAQRIAHTLKGSGNIVGVSGIAVLTHHLEEILEYLTKHETFPTKALSGVLLESADCLEMMSDLMLNGEKEPPEQALQVLQNVLNWANQIATSGLPTEDSQVETTTLPAEPDTDITPVVKEAKAVDSVAAMTRVPSEKIDQLLRMTGEGSILSEQFKERIKRFSDELKTLNELTWHIQSLVSELDQSINIQSYSTKTGRSGVASEFDALEMEQYNELHTAASRISEAATDIREINIQMDQQLVDLKYLMAEEDTIQKENQELVQSIRMVPASTITSRCQRIVRQACRATNKEVELEINGADILIDSEILNDMVEPLMHLLRNSIDHGIEPVHIREKFNKPKVGKITLEFSRKGNYAVITCKDDGGGLASGNILQTAIKKGLISAKQQLTEAEIHKLILIPGFSTRAVVTQTSGRGIGMDAIQTKISAIQGQMSLFSARGEGLTIEITIPLTLSSMLSLLVKCGGQTMAISNRGLRKIHHAGECTVVEEEGQLYCDIDYKRYAAKYFAELVGMPITYSAKQQLQGLRIEDEIGRTHIVFVEELLGYRDLLVKDMGSYIPHIQGITGASILGNGDVAPVIDLVEMLHHAAKYDYVLADATKALADSINGLPVALVIDDSLSARRAVAMLLKDSGLEVETAIDGLDAIKQIEKIVPDIILVDLEMPRMNGIELTAHVRGREDMKNTPIIMITSRATEKHRKQAEAAGVTKFMTKPFTEDDLINSVRMLMK